MFMLSTRGCPLKIWFARFLVDGSISPRFALRTGKCCIRILRISHSQCFWFPHYRFHVAQEFDIDKQTSICWTCLFLFSLVGKASRTEKSMAKSTWGKPWSHEAKDKPKTYPNHPNWILWGGAHVQYIRPCIPWKLPCIHYFPILSLYSLYWILIFHFGNFPVFIIFHQHTEWWSPWIPWPSSRSHQLINSRLVHRYPNGGWCFPVNQWEFQDPRIEVVYHIVGHILWGYSQKSRPKKFPRQYMVGTSNLSIPENPSVSCFL